MGCTLLNRISVWVFWIGSLELPDFVAILSYVQKLIGTGIFDVTPVKDIPFGYTLEDFCSGKPDGGHMVIPEKSGIHRHGCPTAPITTFEATLGHDTGQPSRLSTISLSNTSLEDLLQKSTKPHVTE